METSRASLKNWLGDQGFFTGKILKVGHFPYIFLNFLAVFLCMHITENCKHYWVIYGSEKHILRHAANFMFCYQNLAMWLVPLAAESGYFMRMREGFMETYWKVSEVAAAIQVSVQTVYRYVANGEIPFHKLNKAVRFKPSEIESWMESRKAGAAASRIVSVGVEGK